MALWGGNQCPLHAQSVQRAGARVCVSHWSAFVTVEGFATAYLNVESHGPWCRAGKLKAVCGGSRQRNQTTMNENHIYAMLMIKQTDFPVFDLALSPPKVTCIHCLQSSTTVATFRNGLACGSEMPRYSCSLVGYILSLAVSSV